MCFIYTNIYEYVYMCFVFTHVCILTSHYVILITVLTDLLIYKICIPLVLFLVINFDEDFTYS